MLAGCYHDSAEQPGNRIRPFSETIFEILKKHGDSPNLTRRDGKFLIFGYHSRDILRTCEMALVPESPEKWKRKTEAYHEIERLVGEDLYFHFCFDSFFHNVPQNQKMLALEWKRLGLWEHVSMLWEVFRTKVERDSRFYRKNSFGRCGMV